MNRSNNIGGARSSLIHTIALIAILAPVATLQGAETHFAQGLLLKWRDGPASAAAAEANARIGVTVKRSFTTLGWQWVDLPPGVSLGEGLAAYRALDSVIAVEPNGRFEVFDPATNNVPAASVQRLEVQEESVPDDPRFRSQWNLRLIGMTNAWKTSTGSRDIVVAVLDYGIDYTHDDLRNNLWRNPGETGVDGQGNDKANNGLDDDQNGYVDDVIGIDVADGDSDPLDPYDHGTAVAGVIGASGNNGLGITGVVWSTQLMIVRIIRASFPYIPYSSQLEAAEYVLEMKRRGVDVRVSNHSYGIASFSRAINESLEALNAAGILTVFAAMNLSINHDSFSHYGAAYDLPLALNVAATDSSDLLADFSNYGRDMVELAAPGSGILTTAPTNQYDVWKGTSFAAPHVAGAAALLAAIKPDATAWDIRAALMHSTDRKLSLRDKVVTQGRLNVARAVEALTNANLPPIVVAVTPSTSRTRPEQRLEVWFSQPMDRESVESAFESTPPLSGTFVWADDSKRFQLTGAGPFARTNHTVRLRSTARSVTGALLDGNFDRESQDSTNDDYVWEFGFGPLNDDFDQAEVLANATGSVTGNNFNASRMRDEEPYSPSIAHPKWWNEATLWYRWTAPENGWITFETTRTFVDTLLTVYTGDSLSQLTEFAYNDNDGPRLASRVSFGAKAGTDYYLDLSGQHEFEPLLSMGTFTLRWYPTPSPTVSGFTPISGIPGALVTLTGKEFTGATAVQFNGASAPFSNALANSVDLRITAVVPPEATSGPITIITPHGSVTSTAAFQVLPPPLSIQTNSAGQLELRWPATRNDIALEEADSLLNPGWSLVSRPIVISEGVSKLTIPADVDRGFYRLRAP